MPTNNQPSVIRYAQNELLIQSLLLQAYNLAVENAQIDTDCSPAITLSNFATVARNADGSFAAANDQTPNTDNPINVPTPNPIGKSFNQITAYKGDRSDFITWMQAAGTGGGTSRRAVAQDAVS